MSLGRLSQRPTRSSSENFDSSVRVPTSRGGTGSEEVFRAMHSRPSRRRSTPFRAYMNRSRAFLQEQARHEVHLGHPRFPRRKRFCRIRALFLVWRSSIQEFLTNTFCSRATGVVVSRAQISRVNSAWTIGPLLRLAWWLVTSSSHRTQFP